MSRIGWAAIVVQVVFLSLIETGLWLDSQGKMLGPSPLVAFYTFAVLGGMIVIGIAALLVIFSQGTWYPKVLAILKSLSLSFVLLLETARACQ